MPRHISSQGLCLIQSAEGFSPIIYICPAGVKTIGFGHALKPGEDSKFVNGITIEEATDLLKKDVESAEQAVLRLIVVPLEDGQFDALVDFTFNLGSGALQRSTLRSKLNRYEYYDAAEEFLKWVWGGGRILPGLVKRRKLERNLFLYGALI